ncbi:MAG: hypothetical protein M1282_14200 [Chloroflexi bacterium]|nr:hypothetical protein [Chloroflexota bacterium]
MFDNLREQANSSPFYEEEAQFQPAAGTPAPPPARPSTGRLLGMTAFQRFVLAVMLMMVVCVVGSMMLLVTGKIVF